ncbi:CinY protein [Actinomadura sp. DSM 109109]|nr:CinY protein [Actinomadura lepetitiana]
MAVLALTATVETSTAPDAQAFATPYWYSQAHGEHEKVTRAGLACKDGQESDGSCFEPASMTQLAGERGLFGGVGRPDIPAWMVWPNTSEASDPVAHCDEADYISPEDNGGKVYPRSRQQASEQLVKCLSHLRSRFHDAAQGTEALFDEGTATISRPQARMGCNDFASPGRQRTAKCRFIDLFGRVLHGTEDFYSHSNWADQADPDKPISAANPPGLKRDDVFPLMYFRQPVPSWQDVPEKLATGCYPSDECNEQGRTIRHDEELSKDRAIIDPVTGKVTLDNPTPRGAILDNEQRAVTGAINEIRRQWRDMRAEIRARYGEDRGNTIICVMTHDEPVGNWPWTSGDCEK